MKCKRWPTRTKTRFAVFLILIFFLFSFYVKVSCFYAQFKVQNLKVQRNTRPLTSELNYQVIEEAHALNKKSGIGHI